MANLAVPNTLVSGTTITAAQHNQNYDAIESYINDRNAGDELWDNMGAVDVQASTLTATTSVSTVDLVATGDITAGTLAVTGLTKTTGGLHVGGTSDPGTDNALIDGTLEVTGATTHTGLVKTVGGLHVGGTSDPGADNIIVDGTAEVVGHLHENTRRVFSASSMFQSDEVAIATNTDSYVAHSLGAVPSLFTVVMRCKTGEYGYSAGDEVLLSSTYTGGTGPGLTAYANDTNIGFYNTTYPAVYSRADGSFHGITLANWKLVFRAWY